MGINYMYIYIYMVTIGIAGLFLVRNEVSVEKTKRHAVLTTQPVAILQHVTVALHQQKLSIGCSERW